jgi:hypothetical protein
MKTLIKLFANLFKTPNKKNKHKLYTPDPKKEPETELDYNPYVHRRTNNRKRKNDIKQRPLF